MTHSDVWIIPGAVASGLGKGALFVSIEWVRSRLTELMGIPPFPGTLNVRVAPQIWAALFAQRTRFDLVSEPGMAGSCPGYLAAITLRTHSESVQQAWVILPEVTVHTDFLEIVSPHHLRNMLGLSDGDFLEVIVSVPLD